MIPAHKNTLGSDSPGVQVMSVVSHSTCLGDELSLPWWEISFSSLVIPKYKILASIKVKVIKEMYIATLFTIALKLGLCFFAVFFINKIITDLEQRRNLQHTLRVINFYYTDFFKVNHNQTFKNLPPACVHWVCQVYSPFAWIIILWNNLEGGEKIQVILEAFPLPFLLIFHYVLEIESLRFK